MVSSNRNNQLCASFSVFRSLSLSLCRTSFTTPRRGVPLWSRLLFLDWIVSFIPLETTPMDEKSSIWRFEKKSAPHKTEKTTLLRVMTLLDEYDDEHRGGGFLVLLGSSSSSRGLSLSCFFARERRALSQTQGRALVAKTKLSSKREKERGKKRL